MSNENQPQTEGQPQLGDPASPQFHAKVSNAKQALAALVTNPSSLDESPRSLTQSADAMAYSAPGRYAGVLLALEALNVDLHTAPLPALVALVRSIDPDLADCVTAEGWDHGRLIITM